LRRFKTDITDLDELKQRLRMEWAKLDHVVAVAAVFSQWRHVLLLTFVLVDDDNEHLSLNFCGLNLAHCPPWHCDSDLSFCKVK